MEFKAALVPLDRVEPAVYNPRKADRMRLDLLKLSLRKLGFILPLYALENGHLLSGHQRLVCAAELGCEQIPVGICNIKDAKVRNINVVFNRATNDMSKDATSENLLEALNLSRIEELCEQIPDRDPKSPDFFRCLQAEEMPLTELVKGITLPYDSQAVALTQQLLMNGIWMPVVRTQSGKIVNGQYRVMAAGDYQRTKKGRSTYPVVTISDDEAELSELLLNMISMRFTLEDQYADQLRFGSFRRPTNVVETLLPSYRFLVQNWTSRSGYDLEKNPEEFYHKFRQVYGESICDLGAGQRRTRHILGERGIHVTDWEPYPLDWERLCPDTKDYSKPSLPYARQVTDEFLASIRTGRRFTTVGLPAVLNSVPFRFDRVCVLAMAHALIGFGDQLVGTVRNAAVCSRDGPWIRAREDGKLAGGMSMFRLDYEPNVTLGDVGVMPKAQKFHTIEEITADLKFWFTYVKAKDMGGYIYFHAKGPRRINPSLLKMALLHQFELPYENGQRIGRGQEALDAYGERLGIDFSKVEATRKPE